MVQKSLACAPHAGVAQLVEQRIRNAKVVGSTPISGTILVFTPHKDPIFAGSMPVSKKK